MKWRVKSEREPKKSVSESEKLEQQFINPILMPRSHNCLITKKENSSQDSSIIDSGKISSAMTSTSNLVSDRATKSLTATTNYSDCKTQSIPSSTICLAPLFSEKVLKSSRNSSVKDFDKAMSSPAVSYMQRIKPRRKKKRRHSSTVSPPALKDNLLDMKNSEKPSCLLDVNNPVVTKSFENKAIKEILQKSKKFAKCGSQGSASDGTSVTPPESVHNIVTSDYSSAGSECYAGKNSGFAYMVAPWDRLSFSDFTASSLFQTCRLRHKLNPSSKASVNSSKLRAPLKRCNEDHNLHKEPASKYPVSSATNAPGISPINASILNYTGQESNGDFYVVTSQDVDGFHSVSPESQLESQKTLQNGREESQNSTPEIQKWTSINLLNEGSEQEVSVEGVRKSQSKDKDKVPCQSKKPSRLKVIKNSLKKFLKRFNCARRVQCD